MITFRVNGLPKPMGSKRAFIAGGKAHVTDANPKARRQWAALVTDAAVVRMNDRDLFTGPVAVTLHFYMPRPKGHYRSGKFASLLKPTAKSYHDQKPDVDKLARGTLDAITGFVYRDDSQVVDMVATKQWTEKQPGCDITVQELP